MIVICIDNVTKITLLLICMLSVDTANIFTALAKNQMNNTNSSNIKTNNNNNKKREEEEEEKKRLFWNTFN